jgi:hypothetical protein
MSLHTHRSTYEFLAFLGDVGGLLGFFVAVFGALVTWLAQSKITSLIANRFYTWKQPFSKAPNRVQNPPAETE